MRRILELDVDGFLWIKRGSVVAYTGDFRFHLEPVVQAERLRQESGPVRSALKRELVPLSKAVGKGRLLLTDDGRFSQTLRLEDETIYVLSSSLLAFEPTITHELMLIGAVGVLAGGPLVAKLSGRGLVAFSVRGESLTLPVAADAPLSADPASVVAWTDGLWPKLKTDLDAGSIIGHGGGQPIQMLFTGTGEVTVHARRHTDAVRTIRAYGLRLMA